MSAKKKRLSLLINDLNRLNPKRRFIPFHKWDQRGILMVDGPEMVAISDGDDLILGPKGQELNLPEGYLYCPGLGIVNARSKEAHFLAQIRDLDML